MKRIMILGLLIWTIICPLAGLLSNPIVQVPDNVSYFQGVHHKFSKLFHTGVRHNENTLDLGNEVEGDSDIDFFSFSGRFSLTPHYFFIAVYAALLVQFFFFFKRRLPYCHYLATFSQTRYLTQRVLLI